MSALCRHCCKSPKLSGDNFLAVRRFDRRPPIYVVSITLPRSPVSLSSGDEVPHIFTRKSRLQPGEFLITSAKRLLQHNLPEAVIPAPCVVRSTRCTRAVVARRWKAHVPGRRHGSNLILKKLNISPGLDPRVASCPSCSGRPQKKRREEVQS